MKKIKYTISIYTENNVGLLNRISAIFLKRHINIRSITSSESEIPNIYRFIIVVNVDKEQIIKLVKQIEKQIEVIAAYFHTDEETIFLETALYKVKSKSLFNERQIQNIIKESRANIVTSTRPHKIRSQNYKRCKKDFSRLGFGCREYCYR